jgi:hypothetical protein
MIPTSKGIFRCANLTTLLDSPLPPVLTIPQYGLIPVEEYRIELMNGIYRTDSWPDAQDVCKRNPDSDIWGITFN